MPKRAITAKQRAWLLDELSLWRQNAIVTDQQAQRITDLYQGAGELAEHNRSKAVSTLMAAAATLVGLAALLLIGYNWQELSRFGKLGIVLATIGCTHALGFHLRYNRKSIALSNTIFFLGCLFYGAGIWLVAQAFHIKAHYPNGIWWWAVGVLPFAVALETRLLHALLVALLGMWAGMEVLNFAHLDAWLFGSWMPNTALSLPILALPGVLWAYRKESLPTLSLYVPLLAWWTVLQAFAWKMGSNPVYFVGSVGALMLVIAECHRAGSRLAIPYRYYGSILVGGVLVLLSFHALNKELIRHYKSLVGPPALLAVVAVALVALTQRTSGESPRRLFAGRQAIPLAISLLMALLPMIVVSLRGSGSAQLAALLPTVLINIAMVAGAFWLMQIGLTENRGRPFAAGVLYFLLWAVLRYVDLFGNFGGMRGAALMFFACGAVLFGVARYWQNRKEVRYA